MYIHNKTINRIYMYSNPIKQALIDDQYLFRKGLKSFLFSQSNLDVSIEARDVAGLNRADRYFLPKEVFVYDMDQ